MLNKSGEDCPQPAVVKDNDTVGETTDGDRSTDWTLP